MSYQIYPLNKNVVVEPIKSKDLKDYTGKVLSDTETRTLDVLQYGKVISINPALGNYEAEALNLKPGDIVLFQKLAAHKTNFGEPRQLIVEDEHIIAKLIGETDAD